MYEGIITIRRKEKIIILIALNNTKKIVDVYSVEMEGKKERNNECFDNSIR